MKALSGMESVEFTAAASVKRGDRLCAPADDSEFRLGRDEDDIAWLLLEVAILAATCSANVRCEIALSACEAEDLKDVSLVDSINIGGSESHTARRNAR